MENIKTYDNKTERDADISATNFSLLGKGGGVREKSGYMELIHYISFPTTTTCGFVIPTVSMTYSIFSNMRIVVEEEMTFTGTTAAVYDGMVSNNLPRVLYGVDNGVYKCGNGTDIVTNNVPATSGRHIFDYDILNHTFKVDGVLACTFTPATSLTNEAGYFGIGCYSTTTTYDIHSVIRNGARKIYSVKRYHAGELVDFFVPTIEGYKSPLDGNFKIGIFNMMQYGFTHLIGCYDSIG